jgi:glycosyltransferase involved in cell wall biosynthesis
VTEPLITIVMPLKYFDADLLQKAVGSILRQSDPLWHLSVVVEEADIETFRRLLSEALADPRVALVVNRGRRFPGAINTGVAQARTPFVGILLADDMWSPDAVAVLNAEILTHPDVDFFHSSRMVIGEDDEPISSVHRSRETFAIAEFPWGSPVKHLLCWRKSKGLAVGGIDESMLKAQDDYDFPWTMAEAGATFKAVAECLYYYRNHLRCHRLTTHRPLSVTKRGIRMILRKHGIGLIRRTFIVARSRWMGSLGEQCLYRNQIDRWIKDRLGYNGRQHWRQKTYR